MKAPDFPQDEQQRLATLRSLNVLDTPAEERFDQLTRITKRMFRVPIALVSLVDENRQWFKSCIGLSVRETSRDISFCGHALLGNEVLIIPDTMADPRFADNPLVTGDPHIRFYAGCPLAINNHRLGTLCVIDRKPGSFDGEDIAALKDIASMVERELAAVQLATLDELTSLANRRGFMMLAQQSLNLCARQKIPATLAFLDLDKFKPVNDRFGHEEGDRALIAFANQMKSCFRDSDISARLGGDEFVILFTNSPKQQAEELILRFTRSLQQYNLAANRGYDVAFSHGIVEFNPAQHRNIKDLLATGDSLMYEAKRTRR